MEKKTLGEIYNLPHGNVEPKYALEIWYEKFLNKTVAEIDLVDMGRMLRNNILTDLALQKMMKVFIDDPMAGEMYEGEALAFLANEDMARLKQIEGVDAFVKRAKLVEDCYQEFDWSVEENKEKFGQNLSKVLCHKVD